MKLPQVQYRPVQSSGRANLGSIDRQAAAMQQQGQAFQRAMDAIAGVTADYIQRQENAEFNEQIASYNIELSEWQARHNAKQFYTADELPEGLPDNTVPRIRTSTDDNGVLVTALRESIPSYEVYPYLLKHKLEGMIKDKASKISNPNLRNAFVEKAGQDATELMMHATVAAEQAQQSYQLEVGMEKAVDAAQSGNLAMAQFVIENLETDDLSKKKLLEDAEHMVEVYEVTQSIRSNDPETVLAMRSLLEDPQYNGTLDEEQRQAAVIDLNRRSTQLRSEYKAGLTKQHEAFISDAYVAIESGDLTLRDVEVGYQRWLANETDPFSISGTERTALRNAINHRNKAVKTQLDLVQMAEGLINNGGNPWNSDHQGQIDAFVRYYQVNDPRELERITIRSNIMPQVLQDWLNTSALHDAEQGGEGITAAVELYGRLSDMKPEVLRELGKEAKDILADTHILVRGNMPVMEAYKFARETAQVKPEIREQRKRDFAALKVFDENPEILNDLMDEDHTFFGFEGSKSFLGAVDYSIKPNQEMLAQFNEYTRMHYMRTGDIALARKRGADMKERWSPSGVGAQYTVDGISHKVHPMQYAPERLMAISPDKAKGRLEAFARDQELDAENLIVISDDRTARDGSWSIMVFDPETDELRFHPKRWIGADWADEADKYTYNQAVDQAVEKLRINRQMLEEVTKARTDPFWLSKGLRGAESDDLSQVGGN